jgi:integrase
MQQNQSLRRMLASKKVMSLQGQGTTTGALDWDLFKSLIAKMEQDREYKYCLLMTIGVFTGLRISDLLQLRFNQFENV